MAERRTRAATYEDVLRIAELLGREHEIDVTNSASGLTWDDLAPYREELDGVQVVSLEGLLRMKERGRLKDLADAEAIRKALGLGEA